MAGVVGGDLGRPAPGSAPEEHDRVPEADGERDHTEWRPAHVLTVARLSGGDVRP